MKVHWWQGTVIMLFATFYLYIISLHKSLILLEGGYSVKTQERYCQYCASMIGILYFMM